MEYDPEPLHQAGQGKQEERTKNVGGLHHGTRRREFRLSLPEGTRSKTGAVKPFKPGVFILAHSNKIPILPIAINGTRDALPRDSLNFHGTQRMTVRILEEIPSASFQGFRPEETATLVRKRISEALEQLNSEA